MISESTGQHDGGRSESAGWFESTIGCGTNDCAFPKTASEVLACRTCGRSFTVRGQMITDVQLVPGENSLETIDYDQRHGLDPAATRHFGKRWMEMLETWFPGRTDLDILELGAGTGFLTSGLVQNCRFRRLMVCDMSAQFLSVAQRAVEDALDEEERLRVLPRLCYLNCSIDNLPLRPASVDAVLGNSVLHHIYDWELALARIRRVLRPGGVVVFSEPVIQGKAYIGFLAALISILDARAGKPAFTEPERQRLADLTTMCTRGFWARAALQNRDTADDKHLFDIDRVKAVALQLGYVDCDAIPFDPIEDGLRGALENAMRVANVGSASLGEYQFLFDAVQRQLVGEIPRQIPTHHVFFVLRR